MIDFFKRAAFLFLSLFIFTAACSKSPGGDGTGEVLGVVSVVVTLDALFEVASVIGGDRVSVRNVVPDGAEVHHFEPSARDLAFLSSADVFLMCGLGLEPWAAGALDSAGNGGLIVGDVSLGIEPIFVSGGEFESDGGAFQGPGGAGYDPHIWLSLNCAAVIAENVRDVFIIADPDGVEYFSSNCDAFVSRLGELFVDYDDRFSLLDNRTLVTGHAVFAYLCRDFGLFQNSIEGVFEDGEPSARSLAELIDFCRVGNITAILAERLSSPLVVETLAAECGAEVLVIYTMESAEDGKTYSERMTENLAVIYESLN